MEEGFRVCVLFCLVAVSFAWPRYGRPHPLYSGRLQTNENIFANAVLLGLDFNDLQSLQAASGNMFGLGNMGLPNSGFPMNAYERRRARQDVNTLTALGVIDGPEEAGPYGSLVRGNRPDPPDNPGGREEGGKKKKKTGKKSKINGNSKFTDKNNQVNVNANLKTINAQNTNNSKLKQDKKSVSKIKERQGIAIKAQLNAAKHINVVKAVQEIKTAMPKQNLATKVKATRQNDMNMADKINKKRKGVVKKSKKRKTRRKGGEGGDTGEGRLAEQGEMPLKVKGKRVMWRTSRGEDAQIGGGEVLDRRLFVGRF